MSRYEKLILQILSGTSDANIKFIVEKINLQREGNKAKPYQVKQVRTIILKYKLGGK